MLLLEQAVLRAQQEVVRPSHGSSEQAFAIHKPVLDQGVPQVAYVAHDLEPGAFFVYFPLVDEPYYFVVVIRAVGPEVDVSTVYFEAAVHVSLVVTSEVLLPDTITQQLGIIPTMARAKGAPIQSSKREAPFTLWQFEPHHHILGDIEYKLNKLVADIMPRSANIVTFSDQADATTHTYIRIIYKGYASQMWGWSLLPTTVQQLALLNIGVDLDLYASEPEVPQ